MLRPLECRGFDGAPRFLGPDGQGRGSLGFLPGDVPRQLGPQTEARVCAAARLLRRFHDAPTVFAPVGAAGGGEAICHNDRAPSNAVFRNGLPVALIDFDTTAPELRPGDPG